MESKVGDKNILGRGLSEIFDDSAIGKNIVAVEIPLNKVEANWKQPRKFFDDNQMSELVDSVRNEGILQPIIVRKVTNEADSSIEYQIIAGERRWRAAKILDFQKIPAVILECNEETALQLGLIENLQREDLSPLEEANSIRALIDDFGKTQEEIAKMLSKSRSYISNTLRLLKLPDSVKDLLRKKQITAGHARAILLAEDQEGFAKNIIENNMSVRETENIMRQQNKAAVVPSDLAVLERTISDKLKMYVRIIQKSKGGIIQIFFDNYDDLDTFIERFS